MPTTAIIAAYNEGPRLGPVLDVLTTYAGFDEIIVSDDGSTDDTGAVAQRYPVTYLRSGVNHGKGAAMARAAAAARGDILFFCDADVRGLTHAIIQQLLAPVERRETEMSVAMRRHPTFRLFPWLLPYVFQLGGERAVRKRLWEQVPAYYKNQFRIEMALNFFAKKSGAGYRYIYVPALTQTLKNKKRGALRGNWQRLRMAAQILATAARLHLIG